MPACPVCRSPLPDLTQSPLSYCSRCGADVQIPDTDHWVPIARLTNLAELGYFEDLLLESGIESRLVDDDNFDALHGVWRGSYAIWVRMGDASDAADLVEGQLETADQSDAINEGSFLTGSPSAAALAARQAPNWKDRPPNGRATSWSPFVACLLAGGIAYWGGHSLVTAFRQPAAGNPPSDLSQALESLDRPLATPEDGEGSRVVLRSDRASRSIWLEEDLDGDGEADARHQFRDGRLVTSKRR